VRVVVLCDGQTEQVLRPAPRAVLDRRTAAERVGVDTRRLGGSVVRGKLRRIVALEAGRPDAIGVIGLTDVCPEFQSAEEAKTTRLRLVADSAGSDRFRAHVAKFELEAWLMPFGKEIAASVGVAARAPGGNPGDINDQDPPSKRLQRLYRLAGTTYQKPREGAKWLTADRLEVAARACPELKAFLNSILQLAGAEPLP